MRPIIGIDFGTTNSLCAWLDGDRPTIIPNARGSRLTPSVVAVTAKGETLVGESAKNQAYVNPENTVAGVKRLLGSEGLLSMGGKNWRPEEIVSLVLSSLKRDAELHLSTAVERAVITAPAHFSDRERRALVEAGRLSGLEVLRIVNEPTAAAVARSWRLPQPLPRSGARPGPESSPRADVWLRPESSGRENVLVYDYGGGTFDVTVLSREGSECRVLSSRGDGRLGGADLDRELRRLAAERLKAEGLNVDSDRFLAQQLAEAAERAKIELSEREGASIALAFAAAGGGKLIHASYDVGRAEFEELALPYVERSLALVDRALRDSGLKRGDIDSLVLSGGSSRMPIVRRMLKEMLGLDPEGGVNPEEVVVLGAAIFAALASDPANEGAGRFTVRDVVSRSYGVEADGGLFIPLIKKNSPVPSTRSRVFTTVSDGQESVEIHVLQGESRVSSEDLSLGKFLLTGIKSAKAGSPRVKVDFAIDESDMLLVSAVDLESGIEQTISIADVGRGASDESREELAGKTALLAKRLEELRSGLSLERGLEAELDELRERSRRALADSGRGGDGGLEAGGFRMLKAELEGLVGELLARRAEARTDARSPLSGLGRAKAAFPSPSDREGA
jgi:molecular chaperone DnaK